jgi:hypothetical protein
MQYFVMLYVNTLANGHDDRLGACSQGAHRFRLAGHLGTFGPRRPSTLESFC